MEDCATRYKRIGHSPNNPRSFISLGLIGLDGLLGNLAKASYPCLIAERSPDKRLADNLSDCFKWQSFFSFFILYQAEPGNASSIRKARDNAELDANQIVSRLCWDVANGEFGHSVLDTNSIRIQGVGPLGDFAHGVMVSFSIAEFANLQIADDDWLQPNG